MAIPLLDQAGNQLLNASEIDVPIIQGLAEFVNSLYILVGGFVGVAVVLFILRWREGYLLRRRMEDVEAAVLMINQKLDKLLKKRKKK